MVLPKDSLGDRIFIAEMFFLLGVSVSVLNAQSDRGTITGTVTDQTGAVVVGASVTAMNTGTGINSKTTTGANGSYTIPLLPVGTYQVSAEHSGSLFMILVPGVTGRGTADANSEGLNMCTQLRLTELVNARAEVFLDCYPVGKSS